LKLDDRRLPRRAPSNGLLTGPGVNLTTNSFPLNDAHSP